jgi:predicted transcriptional regulator
MSDNSLDLQLLQLTADIVSAHVGNNAVSGDTLPTLIQSVFATLSTAGKEVVEPPKPEPAVPVKKSVFADYLVCLEDGRRMTMLKRHLATAFNLTPAQYRERWGLPGDYPMVAPEYAARRSTLAKAIGLGRKPRFETPPKPAKRGRKAAATG